MTTQAPQREFWCAIVRMATIARRVLTVIGIFCLMPVAGGAAPAQKNSAMPDLKMVDGPALKKALASQRGKVVVVNFWATWCAPCVEEFPDLVKLHNSFKSRGLVVVGVSVDDPEAQSKVISFLSKQKATFPAYLRKPGDMDAFINAVHPEWNGAIPLTLVYDRNGKQVGEPMIGAHSYAKFAAAVEPLL
jgi:thiol-disulfide isomerase/thioredoxin